ncbi:MAG: sialidase family protein [Bryobacteraceae bacterium]
MHRSVTLLLFASLAFAQTGGRWYHPKTQPLPSNKMGPFVSRSDGGILTVEDTSVFVSKNGGAAWDSWPMFPADRNLKISNERSLVRTRAGTIVAVFVDMNTFKWGWDDAHRKQASDVRADVWAARSTDDGKTWTDIQMIQRGYCGDVHDMIQTRSGKIVVTAQNMIPQYARHYSQTHVSGDEGKTWQSSNILDLGGTGHHEGAIEGTLEQLKDGRVWLLLRTSLDRFWEAFSTDDGLRWTVFQPSSIEAGTSPGMLKRLKSGRLVLFWNRPQPEGQILPRRPGGQAYSHEVWTQRGELSMAFSNDDGKTWTKPVVIAREPKKSLAYPRVYERKPGELWVTTMQEGVRRLVREADFVK